MGLRDQGQDRGCGLDAWSLLHDGLRCQQEQTPQVRRHECVQSFLSLAKEKLASSAMRKMDNDLPASYRDE